MASAAPGTARRPRGRLGRALRLGAFVGLTGSVAAITVGLGLYLRFAPTVPHFDSLDDYQPKLGSRIYAADGQLVGEFAIERRVLVPQASLPPLLPRAFMAAEDKRFYVHHGLDFVGMAQAVADKVLHPGEKLRGASTITQQVAKSLLVTHETYEAATERSLSRKLREALLARHLERRLSKDQILFMYLTQTFLGHKAYGVGAAAEHYFRKEVGELTLAEMATLAGLPQRPSDYSPVSRPEAALNRRRYVLRRMAEDGYITAAQQREAAAAELTVYPREEAYLAYAPFYTEQVRRELVDRFGERAVLEDGLVVHTSLDLEAQALAQAAVDRGLHAVDERQGYRGPLAHLEVKQRAEFRRRYRALLGLADGHPPPFAPDVTYLGVVTSLSRRGDWAGLDVAGRAAVLPLAGMRWARAPNPLQRVDAHYVRDVRQVLAPGDVVQVRPTTPAELAASPHNAKAADEALPRADLMALVQEPIAEGALAAVDPRTGEVRVQVGGYDFDTSSYNRAVQACREPGSAFKPVVYTAAIDKYDYTPSTLIDDKPVVFDDFTNATRWKPNNATARFRGRLPMRTCVKDSINTPAIRVAEAVGIDDVLKNARRLGISTPLKRELGTALGSSCTTLMDLMTMFTTVSQYGARRDLNLIRQVTDRFGNVLVDHTVPTDPTQPFAVRLDRAVRARLAPPPQVLDPATGFVMVSLLQAVIDAGTGYAASKTGQVAAGKTGTTNESYDAWFLGFTRSLLVGAWVGHDRKERPLGVSEQGGRTALPVWVDFVEASMLDRTVSPPRRIVDGPFEPPPGVVEAEIDPETGLLARAEGGRKVTAWYREGTEPTEVAPDKAELNPVNVDVFEADNPDDE